MQCLTQIDASNFQVQIPQPTEYTICTYVLAQQPDISVNSYALTVSQGNEIAVAIALLWATGYLFRVASILLQSNDGASKNE